MCYFNFFIFSLLETEETQLRSLVVPRLSVGSSHLTQPTRRPAAAQTGPMRTRQLESWHHV